MVVRLFLSVVALVGTAFISAQRVWAQQMTQAEVEAAASILGLDPNGRHMKRIIEGNIVEEEVSDAKPVRIKHLRGKQGIALPNRGQVNAQLQLPDGLKEQFGEFFTWYANKNVEAMQRPAQIPDCFESGTAIEQMGGKVDVSQAATDILFLRPEQKKMDSDEIYGSNTMLMEVGSGTLNAGAQVAGSLQIQCVPYRIRFLEGAIEHRWGKNALVKFDAKGKESIDDRIKDKVGS